MESLQPKSNQFLLEYSNAVSLFQEGDIELAKDSFEQLAQFDPDCIAVLHNLSACYMRMKQYDDAEQTLEKVIELNPTQPDSHFNAGKVACLNGQFSEAIGYFEYAIKYGYDKHTAILARGIAYHGNQNIPEALSDFSSVLLQQPDNLLCLHYRLSCLISLQEFTEALKDIKQLESLGASSSELSAIKATCVEKRSSYSDAFTSDGVIPVSER